VEHRIRSAGILIQEQSILLVKVRDFSGEYWIPPGGGFEIEDVSTKGCLRREFVEETGLEVEVGELICVREFLETTAGRYNAEFFYHIPSFSGTPHIDNLHGLNDEELIQSVEWVPLAALSGMRTYPADLNAVVELTKQKRFATHLGSYIQGNDETVNHL